MNTRSGWLTFLLFLILSVLIILQVLSMVQSDRLYNRLNTVLDRVSNIRQVTAPAVSDGKKKIDLPMPEYKGDEGDWLIYRLSGEPATLNMIHDLSGMYTNYIVLGNIF